jgi:CHAT domain-containing protein
MILLLPLTALQDRHPGSAERAYQHAWLTYTHGNLVLSQQEAVMGYRQFQRADPYWADKFKLLEAENLLWRGFYAQSRQVLSGVHAADPGHDESVRALVLEALDWTFEGNYFTANQKFIAAESICSQREFLSCGELLKARGSWALAQEQYELAWKFTSQAYAFAQSHGDRVLESRAALNLGQTASHQEHIDQAQRWNWIAYRDAVAVGDEDVAMIAIFNYGMNCFELGDTKKTREMFVQAEQTAERLGDQRIQFSLSLNILRMDAWVLDYSRAIQEGRQVVNLARQLGNKADIFDAMNMQAFCLLWGGELDEADRVIQQSALLVRPDDLRSQLYLDYMRGFLAARRHQDGPAETLFRRALPQARKSDGWRFEVANQLATVLERQGHKAEAEKLYKDYLAEFEGQRAQKTGITARLTYLSYGMPVYGGYIQFLVHQGRIEEALAIADQSRARTMTQGMGESVGASAARLDALHPRQIAQKTGATLLYYWLGREQSMLWVITPQKVSAFPLPREKEIATRIVNYQKSLLAMQDPLSANSEESRALYSILVAPAVGLLRPNAPVILIGDGILGKLNFETLLAPGRTPGQDASTGSHYWIEDVTLRTAPSLAELAAARPAVKLAGKLLLMGDADPASEDYPELPMASLEMKLIGQHFAPSMETVLSHTQATPTAYIASAPQRYAYIHFVTHGVASSTDPLESSIILSRATAEENSFKLYARDILQHPVNARLVTISACYGSGARVYAGEGLVGLSWAFLHAGAQNVIGTLWEVSDESTPRLMDSLYQGLQQGQLPASALRQAKLKLLHSTSGNFRAPFYWAPFQVYSEQ